MMKNANGPAVSSTRLLDGVCCQYCVDVHHSPWFFGPHGFLLINQQTLPFERCTGALGFFRKAP
jgi:hypothetical protein